MPPVKRLYSIPLDTFETKFENVLHLQTPILNGFIHCGPWMQLMVDCAMGKVRRGDNGFSQYLTTIGIPSDIAQAIAIKCARELEKLLIDHLDEKVHYSNYRYHINRRNLYLEETIYDDDSDELEGIDS